MNVRNIGEEIGGDFKRQRLDLHSRLNHSQPPENETGLHNSTQPLHEVPAPLLSTTTPSIKNSDISRFIVQTYEIFNSKEHADCCGWGDEDGTTVIVHDVTTFQNTVLPKFFKHQNYQSFVRQLNLYGFHKTEKDPSRNVFKHPYFQRDREDLMPFIKRKGTASNCERKGGDPMSRASRNDTRRSSSQNIEHRLQILESARFQSEAETKSLWEHVMSLSDDVKTTQNKIDKVVEMMMQFFALSSPVPKPAIESKPTQFNLHRSIPPPSTAYPSVDSLNTTLAPKIEPYSSSRVHSSSSEPGILNMLFQLTGTTAERPLQIPQHHVTSQPFPYGGSGSHFGVSTPTELTTYNSSDQAHHCGLPKSALTEVLPTSKGLQGASKSFQSESTEESLRALKLTLLNSLNSQSGVQPRQSQPWPPANYNPPPTLIPGSSVSSITKHYGTTPSYITSSNSQQGLPTLGSDEKDDEKLVFRNTIAHVANQDRSSNSQIDRLQELMLNFVQSRQSNSTSIPSETKV